MNVYRITIWQDHSHYVNGHREEFDVRAPTAFVALKKALTAARRNGFQRSKPLEVETVQRVASDVI